MNLKLPTVFFGLCALTTLTACSILNPTPAKLLQTGRANITTGNTLSQNTQGVIVSAGFTQNDCLAALEQCIAGIDSVFIGDINKPKFATLAEIYYAHAQSLKLGGNCQNLRPPIDPNYASAPLPPEQLTQKLNDIKTCQENYLISLYNAVRYSYAYLFYNSLTNDATTANPYIDGTKSGNNTIVSETHIKAQDIYHIATSDLINEGYLKEQGVFSNLQENKPTHQEVGNYGQSLMNRFVGHTKDGDYTLTLYLAKDLSQQDALQTDRPLSELTSMFDSRLPNLSVTSTRFGIGTGYVGSLNDRHTSRLLTHHNYTPDSPPNERIYPMSHLLLTAVVIPKGDTLDEVLSTKDFDVHFFNPYKSHNIQLLGESYPLYANFSAGYAKWLSENQFGGVALANMLDNHNAHLPELYLLEPYNPDKKVIIMIHGLASSPKTWVNLTNSLLADPILRDNYQVWQIFYSTNLPMLENRYQVQQLIETAFDTFDPSHQHPASKNAVIISHSMGAVISRLMLSNDNLNATMAQMGRFNRSNFIKIDKDAQNEFNKRTQLSALPQVDTAVFVSAPFRGTDYADRWFTRGLRRVIRLPIGLTQSVSGAIKGDTNANFVGNLFLQNGASQLSNKSAFMQLTQDITINPNVRYHLIMANNTGNSADINSAISGHISDGIVPYSSSHLEGADSEIIIDGGHSIHEDPKTVLHLRQILHSHTKSH